MKTTVRRWGSSLAVCIPEAMAQAAKFAEDDEVDLLAESGRLVVQRHEPPAAGLEALLAQITDDNLHPATEWGAAEGRELL